MVLFSVSKRHIGEGSIQFDICQIHIGKAHTFDRFNVESIKTIKGRPVVITHLGSAPLHIPIPKSMVKRARSCMKGTLHSRK